MSSTANSTKYYFFSFTSFLSPDRILTPQLIIQTVTQNSWTAHDEMLFTLHINIHVSLDFDDVRRWRWAIIIKPEIDRIGIMAPVGCLDQAWPCIVGIDLSKLGRIDDDSARDGHRDRLSTNYLERCATILEMLDAFHRAELPTAHG